MVEKVNKLAIIFLCIFVYAYGASNSIVQKFGSLSPSSKNNLKQNEDFKRKFGYLLRNKNRAIQDLADNIGHVQAGSTNKIANKIATIAKQNLDNTPFLSKAEAQQLANIEMQAIKNLIAPYWTFIYFYSSSVPPSHLLSSLFKIGILQDNGVNVLAYQYMIGIPDNLKDMLINMEKSIEQIPKKSIQDKIKRNFHLKFDPVFFGMYDVKKVPAIGLARCSTIPPDPQKCKMEYMIRGKVSLERFLKLIEDRKDQRFIDWYGFLIANGIHPVSEKTAP